MEISMVTGVLPSLPWWSLLLNVNCDMAPLPVLSVLSQVVGAVIAVISAVDAGNVQNTTQLLNGYPDSVISETRM
jgi:hypothetical protein